jgi:hypothetical protein
VDWHCMGPGERRKGRKRCEMMTNDI